MKCRVCRGPAIIDVRRHNANFCSEHFLRLCRDQVTKAIEKHSMLQPGDRVLVAVSGGKDSLALWDILLELDYEADGLYLGLGIDGYSDRSGELARRFADARGLCLEVIDLPGEYGFGVPEGARAARLIGPRRSQRPAASFRSDGPFWRHERTQRPSDHRRVWRHAIERG